MPRSCSAKSHRNVIIAALSTALISAGAFSQTEFIATGTDADADGYLAVRSDAHGSWSFFASPDPAEPCDLYNPPGPDGQGNATFSTFFYVFADRDQREILHAQAQLEFPHIDDSLSSEIVAGPTLSDTDADGVPDTLDSLFLVSSPDGGTSLLFSLRQQVRSLPTGAAYVRLDATVLNQAPVRTRFSLLRTWDADLPWSGGSEYFTNDEVGTGANSAGAARWVFVREPGLPHLAATLSGTRSGFYFGGKHGVLPAGGPPAYDFGTDIDWWLAYGVPHTWRNHIAGVGYDTDGASGPQPVGSTAPEDAFCGLESTISLKAGESTTVTFVHTYGQSVPAP